jgi:hypothetical protein
MSILTRERLNFVSRPYEKRVAFLPMGIAMLAAWCVDLLALAVAAVGLHNHAAHAGALMVLACSLATYLIFATYRWFIESKQYYELHLSENSISLSTFNSYQQTRTIEQLPLTGVTSAEYYPAEDTSTIILLGQGKQMEIPLWSFGAENERTIINFLKSSGINIVSIPGNVVF